MAIKTITQALTGLSLIQPSNTYHQCKDSDARFLVKVSRKTAVSETRFS